MLSAQERRNQRRRTRALAKQAGLDRPLDDPSMRALRAILQRWADLVRETLEGLSKALNKIFVGVFGHG